MHFYKIQRNNFFKDMFREKYNYKYDQFKHAFSLMYNISLGYKL